MNAKNRAVAVIDLDAAANNIREIRRIVRPEAKIMAIIKSNAYSHGAVDYAKKLLENGADYLGVAASDEGLELRKAGINAPVLLLGFTSEDSYDDVISYGLIQTVYTKEMAETLNEHAKKLNKTVKIHIKVETGMNRLGFIHSETDLVLEISKLENLEIEGIYTHFTESEDEDQTFTNEQRDVFLDFVHILEENGLHIPIKHVSNSAAIISRPDLGMDMVRAGIIIYGIWPGGYIDRTTMNLIPVMTLKSCLSHVKNVEKGGGIGYNRTHTLKRDSIVGTVPIGYADGIGRALSNRGRALVCGKSAPMIGRVCMDQLMLDLTDIPEAKAGDEVVIFGRLGDQVLPVEELAEIRGTIPAEILNTIMKRVVREYVENGKTVRRVNYTLGTDEVLN